MKRVLIFTRDYVCYDTINIFTTTIGLCFNHAGYQVDVVNVRSPRISEDLSACLTNHYDAIFTFNSLGQEAFKVNGKYLSDFVGCPFINFIVDHPMRHYQHLITPLSDYRVICLDYDHRDYIRRCHKNVKEVYTLPLGGFIRQKVHEEGMDTYGLLGITSLPLSDETDASKVVRELTYEAYCKRRKNVVMTGSYYNPDDILEEIKQIQDDVLRILALETVDCMLADMSLTNEAALEHVLEARGITDYTSSDFANIMANTEATNHYINAYVREQVVRGFIEAGAELNVYGNGWEKFRDKYESEHPEIKNDDNKRNSPDRFIIENVKFYKGISYEETASLYSRSKIVLNTMPWFKSGLHDRVPTSMLSGALVLSDFSKYFDLHQMTDNILTFDISNPVSAAETAMQALTNLEDCYKRAAAGQKQAFEEMTWPARFNQMINMLDI